MIVEQEGEKNPVCHIKNGKRSMDFFVVEIFKLKSTTKRIILLRTAHVTASRVAHTITQYIQYCVIVWTTLVVSFILVIL